MEQPAIPPRKVLSEIGVFFMVFCVLVTLALGTALVTILVRTVPTYEETFGQEHATLPAVTVKVFRLSHLVRDDWFVVIPATVIVLAGLFLPPILIPRRRKQLLWVSLAVTWVILAFTAAIVVLGIYIGVISSMAAMAGRPGS